MEITRRHPGALAVILIFFCIFTTTNAKNIETFREELLVHVNQAKGRAISTTTHFQFTIDIDVGNKAQIDCSYNIILRSVSLAHLQMAQS